MMGKGHDGGDIGAKGLGPRWPGDLYLHKTTGTFQARHDNACRRPSSSRRQRKNERSVCQ